MKKVRKNTLLYFLNSKIQNRKFAHARFKFVDTGSLVEVSWHDTGYRQEVCEGARGARGVHESLKNPARVSS